MASPNPNPRTGEFLLHLLQQGRDFGRSGDGGSSSNHSSGSSYGSGSSIDEQAAWHLRDPAVAALGPSHPLRSEKTTTIGGLQLHHQHPLVWSVPPSSPFDASIQPPPLPHPDVVLRPPLDRLLPSPLDPLPIRQPPRNAIEHFQPGPYPYSQFPAPQGGDHLPYIRHPPPPPLFLSHAGFSNPQRVHDISWTNSSLPARRLGPDMESWPGIQKAPAASTVQVPPSFAHFVANGEHPRDTQLAPCINPSASNRSPLNDVSLSGEGLSDFARVSKGVLVGKDYGPITPLKHDEEPFSFNTTEGVGDGWAASIPSRSLVERGSCLGSEFCHQGVCEIQACRSTQSEAVGSSGSHVLDAVAQQKIGLESSSCGATVGDGIRGSQRRVHQETSASKADWDASMNDQDHLASQQRKVLDANHRIVSDGLVNVQEPEGMHGISLRNKARHGRPNGLKADGAGKATNRIGSGHWVAVTKEKNAVEEGVSKAGVADNLDIRLPETAGKSRFEELHKPRDDPKKRRGQAQGWRLKQLGAANHSEQRYLDSKTKERSLLQQGDIGLPSGTNLDSAPSSATEQSKQALRSPPYTARDERVAEMEPRFNLAEQNENSADCKYVPEEEDEETILGCLGFLELDKDNEAEEKKDSGHKPGGSLVSKDFSFGVAQPVRQIINRFHKRDDLNRPDMEECTSQLLSIFQSLIPLKDEELKRNQLFSSLDELVSQNWPEARLYLFGSCANAFGVCNSDIDICLSVNGEHSSKPELVTRLADILRANHMQNVQALTHARVPIVKYSDPKTGISCDVCVNNMLAVVNTRLLRDYAQIDVRLRQLAFIVKHWAKRRQVNETYRGTLSSYAYVLMCIHFLQQRKPPVLPCLQEMEPTYRVTLGNVTCAYYNRVETLKKFGSHNKETLGELLTSFFEYWAFRHDYSHAVISIRTGGFIRKIEKNWTRRVGNERHLICIEDPFEISHDLGRVVDKHSIRVLRDEFHRAAKIMRFDSNPCVTLFDPYVRETG